MGVRSSERAQPRGRIIEHGERPVSPRPVSFGENSYHSPYPPALRRGFLWIGWHCPGDNGYKNACQISPRRRIMWGGCWITARNRMDCRGCRCEECLTGISWCIRSRACNWIFSVAGRRSCSGPRILMELQGQEGGGGRGRWGWGGGDMHLNQGQWDGGRKNKQVSWLLAITEQGFL